MRLHSRSLPLQGEPLTFERLGLGKLCDDENLSVDFLEQLWDVAIVSIRRGLCQFVHHGICPVIFLSNIALCITLQ